MSQPHSYFILKLNVKLKISNLIVQKLKFMLNVNNYCCFGEAFNDRERYNRVQIY